jgi:hydrogenase expression/formation protein HypD
MTGEVPRTVRRLTHTCIMITALDWLERIRALPLPPKIRIMNVCGGHERSIAAAGLRYALPEQIELIAGPGCPVCICPEEDVYEAIQLALHERVVLLAFGDMLRVPVNVPRSEPRSLEQAKAAGADIRPIASPLEAVRIAETERDRTVVLFATGFETTTAPVAAMLVANPPANLFVLLSGRLTWPAVSMLLESGDAAFDALVAPGHVATVMGPEEWKFVPEQHDMPAAIAGFRPDTLLAATYSVLRQHLEGHAFLDNCYGEVVREGGNPVARDFLARTMDVVDANWRGIGVIPRSGFAINEAYAAHDARRALRSFAEVSRKRVGEMPPGCDCARVVLGKLKPNECRLYGLACQPRNPIGPCMVSDEGACRIWWANGQRENKWAGRP